MHFMKKLNLGMAVAILGLATFAGLTSSSGLAQAPGASADGAPGMGPHRPPMERMLGGGPGGGMRGEHGRWWNNPQAIDKWKLTETQRKSMDDIFQQSRTSLIDLHATLDKQEVAMEPLMKADQPDEGRILQQIDRVAQARAELEKANARMLLGIRRQLTPEQWKQIQADRAARRERHGAEGEGRWHGHEGPGGDGPGAPPPQNGPENE